MSSREFFGFLDFLTGNDRQTKPFFFHFPVHEVCFSKLFSRMDVFDHVNEDDWQRFLANLSPLEGLLARGLPLISEDTIPMWLKCVETVNLEDALFAQKRLKGGHRTRVALQDRANMKLHREGLVTAPHHRESFNWLTIVAGESIIRALFQALHLTLQPETEEEKRQDAFYIKTAYGRSLCEAQQTFLRPTHQQELALNTDPRIFTERTEMIDSHLCNIFFEISTRLEKLDFVDCYRKSLWIIALTFSYTEQLRSITTGDDIMSEALLDTLGHFSGAHTRVQFLGRLLTSLNIVTPANERDIDDLPEMNANLVLLLKNAAPQLRNLQLSLTLEELEGFQLPTFPGLRSLSFYADNLNTVTNLLRTNGRFAHCFPLSKLTVFKMAFLFKDAEYGQLLLQLLEWMPELRKLSLTFAGYQKDFKYEFESSAKIAPKLAKLECLRFLDITDGFGNTDVYESEKADVWFYFLPTFGAFIAPNITKLHLIIPVDFANFEEFSLAFNLQDFKCLKTLILQLKWIKVAHHKNLFSHSGIGVISSTVTSLTLKRWNIFHLMNLMNIGKAFPALVELNIGKEKGFPSIFSLPNPENILKEYLPNLRILRFLERAVSMQDNQVLLFLDYLTGVTRREKPFLFHLPVDERRRQVLKADRPNLNACTWLTLQ